MANLPVFLQNQMSVFVLIVWWVATPSGPLSVPERVLVRATSRHSVSECVHRAGQPHGREQVTGLLVVVTLGYLIVPTALTRDYTVYT